MIPASMVLLAGAMTQLDTAIRQTRWEEERLRAELMAASAVAYASAMDGTPTQYAFNDHESFDVRSGEDSEGRIVLECRGTVTVDHPMGGPATFEETVTLTRSVGPATSAAAPFQITHRERKITPQSGTP
jgi:hypothetical protein